MKMTTRLIIIGGLAVVLSVVAFVVFLPYAVFKPADTLYVSKYAALEQEGRDLYVSNGCVYCHSQFTRKEDVTPSEPSQAGDYNYDQPHLLGTLRTGPDLANIGLKRGDRWEIDHLKEPRNLTPDSIMPSFSFLNQHQLTAIVAYLDVLGNHETASTNLMIPDPYVPKKQPFSVTVENWNKGRDIYAKHCLTCHGCSGKGDGPYAMVNNARPADLRQDRFKNLPSAFPFWRISEGVPGTVMPRWKQSLSEKDRWYVALFVQKAYMDMVPHLADEGNLPTTFDMKNPVKVDPTTLDIGKHIFIANCQFCHGYAGRGDGVDAAGLLPSPPDFHDPALYSPWKDGDWFWRVSESLPLRAMPQWHTWFDKTQLWYVANYVRYVLALPDPNAQPVDPVVPEHITKAIKGAKSRDVMAGREVYLKRCWMCHGDAGQGEGPDGEFLAPKPANLTDPALKTEATDVDLYWRVSEGIGNSAMPTWRLLLSEEDRWNAIAYVKATFVNPSEPKQVSDTPPVEYQATDPGTFLPTPDALARGKATYERLCIGCHGAKGKGDGKYGAPLKPTPANLTQDPAFSADQGWWYWRVDRGVVGDNNTHPTAMPAWRFILSEQEKWEVVYYGRQLVGAKGAKP